jgi:hypothetical protein
MDLHQQLRTVKSPGSADRIDPYRIAARGRKQRGRRRALVTSTAIVVVALGVGAVHAATSVRPQPIGQSDGVSPILTFNGMAPLACGGLAPLSALSAPGGAENANTPEAKALRYGFAHDPTGGESPQTPHGWVLLARRGDQVTFGQREGRVGIGATVNVVRKGNGYIWDGSGGCGPIGYTDGQTAMRMETFDDGNRYLTLRYMGGRCDTRMPALRVRESKTRIDVLVVGPKPIPATQVCADVGVDKTIQVPLLSPRDGRTVYDNSYFPALVLPTTAQARAADAEQNRIDTEADSLCQQEGASRGRPLAASFTTAVATVRADVPSSRQPWASLPGDQLAGYCYLGTVPTDVITVATTRSGPAVLVNRHYTSRLLGNLAARPGGMTPS